MEETELYQLQYPIGKPQLPELISVEQRTDWIAILEALPDRMAQLVTPLSEAQLEQPYREGGWTIRQVIHHVSDSHHHSYIRFKWALTEEDPVIKPYQEKEWANLFDTRTAPISLSLLHLSAVHAKLVQLLRGLTEEQWQRTFRHPEGNRQVTLSQNLGHYVWHGNHHYAHIKNALDKIG